MSLRLAHALIGNLQFDLVGLFLSGLLGRFFMSYLLFVFYGSPECSWYYLYVRIYSLFQTDNCLLGNFYIILFYLLSELLFYIFLVASDFDVLVICFLKCCRYFNYILFLQVIYLFTFLSHQSSYGSSGYIDFTTIVVTFRLLWWPPVLARLLLGLLFSGIVLVLVLVSFSVIKFWLAVSSFSLKLFYFAEIFCFVGRILLFWL